ncbi:hypothetical protein HY638_03700 [Candidatus Woesearchaeota archaeon]|nr:hypothetical protein [Candidatus Woesearchaeota archaeon]
MVNQSFRMESVFRTLNEWGLIDVVLPFLLIFTILFAILQKSSLLGENKKQINTVVALIFALIVVIPHVTNSYPTSFDPVEIINTALPQVSVVVVAIVMLLILIGLFGQEKVFLGLSMPGWVALFSFVAILVIFGSAAGVVGGGVSSWINTTLGSDLTAVVVMVLVFGIVIAFITGGEGKKEDISALNRVGVDLKKLFGGGGH